METGRFQSDPVNPYVDWRVYNPSAIAGVPPLMIMSLDIERCGASVCEEQGSSGTSPCFSPAKRAGVGSAPPERS